jgi:hypothetical protein
MATGAGLCRKVKVESLSDAKRVSGVNDGCRHSHHRHRHRHLPNTEMQPIYFPYHEAKPPVPLSHAQLQYTRFMHFRTQTKAPIRAALWSSERLLLGW